MPAFKKFFSNESAVIFLIVLISSFFFIPFLGHVHLFDWDEANFAEAAREMILTGNFMRVTIDFQPFWEKPPLFFWFQVLSMKIFGINEFGARFVNALCGIITMPIVYLIGRKLFNRTLGLLWVLAFIGSFLPHLFYKSGIIDPVFNLFIFLGFGSCIWATTTDRYRTALLRYFAAGILTGLGVLTKGPVAFLVVALCMGVYWASLKFRVFFKAGHILSFFVALGVVAFSFYGYETLAHGPWFITEFTRYQIRLLTTGDAGHGRPFYFHFLVVLFGCFPASFFAIQSFFNRQTDTDHQKLFTKIMIILLAVVMILFSLVKTKTVLYSSLSYFPITFLAALQMYTIINTPQSWKKYIGISLAIFAGLIAAAIAVFPVLMLNKQLLMTLITDKIARACLANPVHWSGLETLVGIAYAIALTVSIVSISRKSFVTGFVTLFIASAFCLQIFMLVFAPKIEQYSQGGPIQFYKEHSGDSAYVRAYFKSYADLFYSNKGPAANPLSSNRDWLLTGAIDRPVYFVARENQEKKMKKYQLQEIKREYGFIYYVRPVPEQPVPHSETSE